MKRVGADSARASKAMQHRKNEDGMKDSLNLQITHLISHDEPKCYKIYVCTAHGTDADATKLSD